VYLSLFFLIEDKVKPRLRFPVQVVEVRWQSWWTEIDTGFHCFNLSTSKSMLIWLPAPAVLESLKCHQSTYYVCWAWAHTELTMLLKKGYRSSFWFLPFRFLQGLVLRPESCLGLVCSDILLWVQSNRGAVYVSRAWAHAELTMLLKLFSTPVLVIPRVVFSVWFFCQ